MNTYDKLNGGSRSRLRAMRNYRDKWNSDAHHIARGSLITALHARSHGIGGIGSHAWLNRDGGKIHMETGALEHLREPSDLPRDNPRGWYADEYQSETITGKVAALPHGRFLAYVSWSDCDGITADASVYDSARDAWHRADDMARNLAKDEREHNMKWNAAREHSDERETARTELRGARHDARMVIRAWHEQRATGPLAPTVCELLRERLETAREAMRSAIVTIQTATDEIADLDMETEF